MFKGSKAVVGTTVSKGFDLKLSSAQLFRSAAIFVVFRTEWVPENSGSIRIFRSLRSGFFGWQFRCFLLRDNSSASSNPDARRCPLAVIQVPGKGIIVLKGQFINRVQ